ncbi:RHS repeat domain-containing protein [Jejuia spongiicola]|uniref:RHS repeat-associated core domain-containing protein n=1 Tax=Jejuia spongiicola TaxID=2942207 RepID=A0ABT0QD41_9FLAO|nr:RHS repeat-associated core domain-containing protein [Jejuia spongiicola]MCL6294853.1 hypothetical protein [Jejuia spongiicola]
MDNINAVNFAYQGGTQTITVTFTQYDPACANESFEFVDVPSWLTITHVSQFGIQIICQANNGAQRTQLIGVKLFGNYVNGFPVIQAQSCHKNWYPDSDGDTFGDKYGEPIWSCTEPPAQHGISYVANNSDRCPDDANTGNYGCPADYLYENINWISSKAYDINGNLKANSKAYFNGLGKGIQSQSVDIKTNRTWANQTLYDTQGRPALSTLSAPVNTNGTPTYKADFIRNINNHTYDSADFENDPENPTAIGETTTNTLGWYYSANNTDSYQAGNNYQDETDYPFARTIYSELNPGVALKSIGGNKQNGEWKQGYTFSMPAGQELSRSKAFNDPAYNTIKTIKTISKDVHGNEVVAFTDTDGKTLAAARVGGVLNPDSTVDISTQGFVDVHVPKGTTGFTINGVSGITTEVYNLITEQATASATNSLTNGFYRVSITNLESYSPTTPSNTVSVTYHDNYYDYSLNEYDEAGRLIASYQPVGNTKAQKPVTIYSYNAVGQLLSTTSPDEGTANFKYRKDGQIRFSQNSKQLAAGEFSYTNYDDLGRPIESGVATGTFSALNADTSIVTTSITAEKQETTYDALGSSDLSYLSGVHSTYGNPSFLASNVAKTSNVNTTTYYSYDVYGRVKWVVQNILGLGAKTIDYKYDQITGAVTEVDFQKHNTNERFIHKYTYDTVDNSLIKVETSTNGSTYTTHANYTYYETGALKQIELAPQNNTGTPLQNIDYVYNLNGQLKAINSGNDANDLFSMQIDYHADDYKRSVSNVSTPNYGENQYNGNIKGVRWKNKELDNTDQTYSYYYNKNNWLKDAINGQYANSNENATKLNIQNNDIHEGVVKNFNATNSITWLPGFYAKPNTGQEVTAKIITGTPSTFQSGKYNVFDITYDANGNIRTLNRNRDAGGGDNKMDQLNYSYNPEKPNQLKRVDDAAGQVLVGKDIDDQDGNNYEYNQIGQLIKNNEENIEYIYNASGLVTQVKKDGNPLVKFFYNDKGHRVKKEVYTGISLTRTDYYVRDASGTALAIYEGATVKEHTIYGVSRLGVYNRSGGSSYYQLTDHLGNVRAVTGRTSTGTPIAIVSATDYYPFGMPMPNRDNNPNGYRYKYQGQEKDPETGKEAFELRLWDSRIGRWLTTDPAGQFNSPYLGMGNNPVARIDPDGGFSPPTDYIYTDDKGKRHSVHVNDGINQVIELTDLLQWTHAQVLSTSYDASNSSHVAINNMLQRLGTLRPDLFYTIDNVLDGKKWVSYADGGHVCGKAARMQCGVGGATPAWDWGQVGLYVDTARQKAESDYKTLTSNVPLALTTIDDNLNSGFPVMTGVEYHGGVVGNLNVLSDHYIVIVGRGNDVHGNYYSYWDNVGDRIDTNLNRLYYNGNSLIDNNTPLGTYTVTEIRPNN